LKQANESLFLENLIPSLREHQYAEKKSRLIELAQRGMERSKHVKPEDLIRICNPAREGRILSSELGVYKKDRSTFIEAVVWETSLLLGCDRWICPSLPIHIHGAEATFQPYHQTIYTQRFIEENSPLPHPISQEDFWALALFSFLVGLSD